jgi:hypothetical protein
MEVSCKLHAPGKELAVHIGWEGFRPILDAVRKRKFT